MIINIWFRVGDALFYLFVAHIKQQSVVDIVDAEHNNNDNGIDNKKFISFNILKKEDQRNNRTNHQKEIENRDTIK